MEYLATTLHRDQYYMMTKHEFNHCKLADETYICTLNHPVYSSYHNNTICELQLLTEARMNDCQVVKQITRWPLDHWIKLKNNHWLFSLQLQQVATIVCEERVYTTNMPKRGKIFLNEGCTLKAGIVTLKGHKIIKSTVDLFFLPTVNLSVNWSLNQLIQLQAPPNESDFSTLHRRIAELEDTSLATSNHDIQIQPYVYTYYSGSLY